MLDQITSKTTLDGNPGTTITLIMSELRTVLYCGVCTLPIEYCEFHPSFPRCQQWLLQTHPALHSTLYSTTPTPIPHSSSRGGKAQLKDTSKDLEKLEKLQINSMVYLRRDARNKRKSTTAIGNLGVFGVEVKKAAKRLAGRFACGASVQKNETVAGAPEEIVLQGDFVDDLLEVLPAEFQIPQDQIEIL